MYVYIYIYIYTHSKAKQRKAAPGKPLLRITLHLHYMSIDCIALHYIATDYIIDGSTCIMSIMFIKYVYTRVYIYIYTYYTHIYVAVIYSICVHHVYHIHLCRYVCSTYDHESSATSSVSVISLLFLKDGPFMVFDTAIG